MVAGWIPASERQDINFLTAGGAVTPSAEVNLTTGGSGSSSSSTTTLAETSGSPIWQQGVELSQTAASDPLSSASSLDSSPNTSPGPNVSMAELQSMAGVESKDVVLWPFDRGESRGKLKAITVRVNADELLVLSYR